MHRSTLIERRDPQTTTVRAYTNRSWLPMQPHLLVALDPIHWSRRARADQRWQRDASRPR